MKKIIAFLFILISAFTYAQDTTQTKPKKAKRFFVGVSFSSDLCCAVLKNPVFDNIDLKAIPKFGFTSGINACYIITKHLSIELGVQYSKKIYGVKTNLTFGDMIDRRRGFVYSSNENVINTINNYNYLDIPVKANFTFGKKKLRLISSIGITTSLFLKATSTSFVVGNNYNRINVSPTISCGIDYKANSRMFFRIEPTFRYGLLKVSGDLATQYLWNTGLNLSWYFL